MLDCTGFLRTAGSEHERCPALQRRKTHWTLSSCTYLSTCSGYPITLKAVTRTVSLRRNYLTDPRILHQQANKLRKTLISTAL